MPDEDDPRDDIEAIVSTVSGLYVAIASGAPAVEVIGHIALLVNRMIEHRDSAARPHDAALLRAISRLKA